MWAIWKESGLRYLSIAFVLNSCNASINPVVYVLRIPELRNALALCCVREVAEMHTKNVRVKSNRTANLTLEIQLTTNYSPANHYQQNVHKNDMDTKL